MIQSVSLIATPYTNVEELLLISSCFDLLIVCCLVQGVMLSTPFDLFDQLDTNYYRFDHHLTILIDFLPYKSY